jgi:hypothetical protein
VVVAFLVVLAGAIVAVAVLVAVTEAPVAVAMAGALVTSAATMASAESPSTLRPVKRFCICLPLVPIFAPSAHKQRRSAETST